MASNPKLTGDDVITSYIQSESPVTSRVNHQSDMAEDNCWSRTFDLESFCSCANKRDLNIYTCFHFSYILHFKPRYFFAVKGLHLFRFPLLGMSVNSLEFSQAQSHVCTFSEHAVQKLITPGWICPCHYHLPCFLSDLLYLRSCSCR